MTLNEYRGCKLKNRSFPIIKIPASVSDFADSPTLGG
jgi:hypothetical protein